MSNRSTAGSTPTTTIYRDHVHIVENPAGRYIEVFFVLVRFFICSVLLWLPLTARPCCPCFLEVKRLASVSVRIVVLFYEKGLAWGQNGEDYHSRKSRDFFLHLSGAGQASIRLRPIFFAAGTTRIKRIKPAALDCKTLLSLFSRS